MKIVYISQLFNNTYHINRHRHEFWEIVYYTHGNGTVNIDGELVPFSENDIFAIPPLVPHFDYSGGGFTNYHFNFIDEEFSYKTYLKLHDTDDLIFRQLLQLLYSEYHLKRENYENITDSLYDVLRSYICSFTKQDNENPYITKIIGSIISNMSDPNFNINDAFADIPLHRDYIRKLFVRQTGMTPLRYLTHNRMICAKQLMKNQSASHLTLKEIAYMSGYSDYYYFSRVFKLESGFSPSEWLELPNIAESVDTSKINDRI